MEEVAADTGSRTASRRELLRAREFMSRTAEILRASGIPGQALQVGSMAPDFLLHAADGEPVTLADARRKGPVVLVFYRGEWCSICMRQLRTWQAQSTSLQRLGATLLAISPEPACTLRHTMREKRLSMPLLSDPFMHAARGFRVAMPIPPELVDVYMAVGVDAAVLDEDGQWELPVPATFLVGRSGRISFARVDLDGTRRTGPREVLPVLQDLADR